MRSTLTIASAAVLGLFMTNCHTYAWQPVADQIKGTWTLLPIEPVIEEWTFDNGKLTISIDGIFQQWDDDGTIVDYLTYRVDNMITNHYVIINSLKYATNQFYHPHESIVKWLVITSGNNGLFLESIDNRGLKGGWQYEFTR